MVNSTPAVFTLASVPYKKLSRSWEPHKWLRNERRLGAAVLKEVREPFGLVGAEPDDRTRLPSGFLECVAHVPDDRLGRPFPHTLERSPPLPGCFQARRRPALDHA
jgi:hypothetical protein